MIITQKFNSVDEIDPEFIPSLEELLCEQIPHFDLIKKYERSRNDETRFNYFLFFGNQTNSPIGFAQIEVEKNRDHKQTFMERFLSRGNILKPDLFENHVRWLIPGSAKEGVVFNPKYIRHAAVKASKIFQDFLKRPDVHTQELYFSTAYDDLANSLTDSYTEKSSDDVYDALIKNKSSYAEFIDSLGLDTSKQIKRAWRYAQKELQFKVGEYLDFREMFEYKKKGALQYKGLKSHPRLDIHVSDSGRTKFITFEDAHEIKSIVIYISGISGHSFYDIFALDDSIPEILQHQQAIMQFFEDDQASKLHYLESSSSSEILKDLGFTFKKQIYLKMKKPVY